MHEQLYRQAQRLYVHLLSERDVTPRYTLRWLRLDWDGTIRRQSKHFDDYRQALARGRCGLGRRGRGSARLDRDRNRGGRRQASDDHGRRG